MDSHGYKMGLDTVVGLKMKSNTRKNHEQEEALSQQLPEDGPEVGAKLQTNKLNAELVQQPNMHTTHTSTHLH